MPLTFSTDPHTAHALAEALAAELGASPDVHTPALDDPRADPVAVAALVLSIPSAALAAWDLAERLRLREALRRVLTRLGPATVVAHSDTGSVTLTADSDPAALIDLAGRPACRWDAFVSYASPDRAAATGLTLALRARGLQVFQDQDLTPGTAWPTALWNHQRTSRATVALLTPHWPGAVHQQAELQHAVALHHAGRHLLIPVAEPGFPPADWPPPTAIFQGSRLAPDWPAVADAVAPLLAS